MDLNALTLIPEPTRPRVMRLPSVMPDVPDLPIFEGGESISEFETNDVALPDSEMNRAKAQARRLIKPAFTEEEPEYQGPTEEQIAAEHEAMRKAKEEAAFAEHLEANFHSRGCPLPDCDTVIRVAKGNDQGDVLGLGMSMAAASKLEGFLIEHLESHTLGEWMAALASYQDALKARFTQPSPVQAPPAEGIIPGPAARSPERQAAIDALDRRLGGGGSAPKVDDDALREMRRQRREKAAKEPSAYAMTPKYTADLEQGVVGIKR